MSLALVFANQYGIVMSADRRLMITTEESNETFLLTEHATKLFLSANQRGFSYTGESNLTDGVSTAEIIETALKNCVCKTTTIADELAVVKAALLAHTDGHNVILFAAGQEDGRNVVLTTNLKNNIVTNYCDKSNNCLAFSGANDIAKSLVDMCPHLRDKLPVLESVSYLKFLTRTVAGIQHYSSLPQTVGDECDVLVIRNGIATWVSKESPF